jgi:hypothetical protein
VRQTLPENLSETTSLLSDVEVKGCLVSPSFDSGWELADATRLTGGHATLEVWDHMVHVWHWFLPMLDEAQAAVDCSGDFTRIGAR